MDNCLLAFQPVSGRFLYGEVQVNKYTSRCICSTKKIRPAYLTNTIYISFLMFEGKTVPQDAFTASNVPMVIVAGISGPSLGF